MSLKQKTARIFGAWMLAGVAMIVFEGRASAQFVSLPVNRIVCRKLSIGQVDCISIHDALYNEAYFEGYVPPPSGDLNFDLVVDAADIDTFNAGYMYMNYPGSDWDLDGDGDVDLEDRDFLVHFRARSLYGDANLDGVVDSSDLNILALNWQGSGGWSQGDFNGDGIINASDLNGLGQNWMSDSPFFHTQFPSP